MTIGACDLIERGQVKSRLVAKLRDRFRPKADIRPTSATGVALPAAVATNSEYMQWARWQEILVSR